MGETMASLEHLDILLGDSLERIVEAADEVRGIDQIDNKAFLMKIGKVVTSVWSIREDLYKIKPSLKRDFVVEREQDKVRYETLDKLFKDALSKEESGNFELARLLYQKLYEVSSFGYFRLLAEAGLYRNNKGVK
jgi:hypothetical protein